MKTLARITSIGIIASLALLGSAYAAGPSGNCFGIDLAEKNQGEEVCLPGKCIDSVDSCTCISPNGDFRTSEPFTVQNEVKALPGASAMDIASKTLIAGSGLKPSIYDNYRIGNEGTGIVLSNPDEGGGTAINQDFFLLIAAIDFTNINYLNSEGGGSI